LYSSGISEEKASSAIRISLSFEMFDNMCYAKNNGIVPLPEKASKKLDIHAVTITGYNSYPHTYYNGKIEVGFFRFANSWGEGWGDNGYGYLPFSYMDNHVIEAFLHMPQSMFLSFLKSEWMYEIIYNNANYKIWFGCAMCHTVSYRNIFVISLFRNGIKLGWLIASKVGNATIEIIDFFVWPDYRLKGYGSIIWREFLKQEYSWNSSLIFHWISKNDIEREGGVYDSTYWPRKRGFYFVENNECFIWSRGILYSDMPNLIKKVPEEKYTFIKKFGNFD